MVVNDFNALGVAVFPNEANTPMAIDPNAALPSAVPLEGFKLIAGRHTQEIKRRSGVKLLEFAQGDGLEVCKPGDALAIEKPLRVAAVETFYHGKQ